MSSLIVYHIRRVVKRIVNRLCATDEFSGISDKIFADPIYIEKLICCCSISFVWLLPGEEDICQSLLL
jgi:hypothetical protein